ncbi:hypothetical protein A9Q87_07135 [Flavobacteriales bacterium 34_180_T64]|nr:hypothetical protein A9Q87_07135 [Flavobacteriales bacterium 34_180_T64]
MKTFKISLLVLACVLCNFTFSQQIIIDNSFNAQQLIENNLIQGCVETSNINSIVNGTVNGFNSFGYFERGTSNFPFENGIMLSTGNATSGGNTQNNSTLNEGQDNWLTDTDLETALGINGTLNATSIEFDFTSVVNQIQFNYILASEEYFGNFPCQYSDGFAFLIKRAGTNDPYTNIAVIPGTSIPVNTNTIHNEIVGFCNAENEQYFEGYNLGDTNYNGRTSVMTATANIIPNIQYHIKLIIADQTDQNYDSAVFIEGNSFNSTVNLGDDIQSCADTIQLNANIDNPLATYTWYLNNTLINGATQTTLEVAQTGDYTVIIEIPLSNSTCVIEDSINVSLSTTQSAAPITNYEICDVGLDTIETFDLSSKNNEVLGSVPPGNYAISYHYTPASATNNTTPINTPIQNSSNPQFIFVRIEDTDSGCLAFLSFELIVNPIPIISQPTDLLICDDTSADGITAIDLSQKDDEITNSQSNLNVTYHFTQADADLGSNAISLPYTNTNQTETLFVRVVNSQTGCVNTTTLNISVLDNPVINTDSHYIDACDTEHDGYASFDLTSIIGEVLEGLTGVSVTFHETIGDAESGINAISNETNYDNTIFEEQDIFIRVEDNTTGCASITTVEIHPNLLLTGTNVQNFSLCDENNDGIDGFDLNNVAGSIMNDIEDLSIVFYETETDRDNQTNPIDDTQLYIPTSNPQTIYITISSPTCLEFETIDLIVNPVIEFDSIGTVPVCDSDQDGFTSIELAIFDAQVTLGQSEFTVTYFETEADATSNSNALPAFYTNISNPQTLYTRITYSITGCADTNEFEIQILDAPITATPSNIIICDNDQDAISIVDLTSVIPELVTDTTDRSISFHLTLSEADSNINSIVNPTAYSSNTQSIFVRVTNTITGCHATESFEIIVNTLPVFIPISNYKICEDTYDAIGDFTFSTKDTEILNGQTGKQTLYFTSQMDADNRTNAIDKNSAFQNTSNPQIIYVRVENLSDYDCFSTASFTIEVGVNPEFNEPTDWFVCDTIENDGFDTFDLTQKISEISQGIPDNLTITFYTSQANAENSINPIDLQYTNTVNPQQIYVQVDNGTICNSITSFELNVIQAPEANPAQPIILCDDNHDGIVTFDLTQSEFDILDVRQDDIVISYFESVSDLDNNTNEITAPESYTNLTNPQTVYVKIENTISNCYLAIPLELQVNLPPAINDFQTHEICDNDTNSFELSNIDSILLIETTDVLVSYYSTQLDAFEQTNALNSNYNYQTNNDTIYARVEFSTTQCYLIYPFQLVVNSLPIAYQPNDLEDCDDDFDGLLEFDFVQQSVAVIGTQNPNNFIVTYYTDGFSAEEGLNDLGITHEAYNGETIFVRIENVSTGCYSLTQFNTIVHPKPILEIGDQVVCLDNLPLLVSANTNNTGDLYLWSTNEITPEIEITEIGTYWVTVTSPLGCETTEVFNVIESEAAIIEVTETIDFSDPNNIVVTISGIGNYLYVLDDGEPQDSPVFENVALGYHTITIIDLNGCAEVTKDVVVIDAPKFMTPNGDSYFDTWHITGVETLPGTIIYIFDRYGKLLTQLTSTSRGWDGRYNGALMPATDYWFLADVKKGDIAFQVKGHFALRL